MISKQIADSVISIISSKSETLATLTKLFHESCSKAEQLSVLTSLATLLMDDILEPPQQIITVWLIQASFPGDIKENPFYDVLQFLYQSGTSNSNSYSQKLCDFINFIISPDARLTDCADRSVHQILDPNFSLADQTGSELVNISFPPLPRISPIIISKADPTATQLTQHQLLRELLMDPSLWDDFDVPFCRPIPEIVLPSPEEYQFMNSDSVDGPPYLFDDMNFLNNHAISSIFIKHAQVRALKDFELESILEEINSSPQFFKENPLQPAETSKILELNPTIGAIFTVENSKSNPNLYKNYEKSDINPVSIEIVKQIMIRTTPPPNFFKNFLGNCSNILSQTKDHQILKTKAILFINLISFLKDKIQFSGDNLLDLHSINVELEAHGIAESQTLAEFLK